MDDLGGAVESAMAGQASPALVRELIERALAGEVDQPWWMSHVVSFVDGEALRPLAQAAVEALAFGGPRHEAAELFILEVSLQEVEALHPHLEELWRLAPNAGNYREMWAWRGADEAACDRLVEVLDTDEDARHAYRAWHGLLQSRSVRSLQLLVDRAPAVWLESDWGRTRVGDVEPWLQSVGASLVDGQIRSLCTEPVLHLRFPDGYLGPVGARGREHPTWHLDGEATLTAGFGGTVDARCRMCDGPLHRMLELDLRPAHPAITGREHLTFVTCRSCLYWKEPVLEFEHDANGNPRPTGPIGPAIEDPPALAALMSTDRPPVPPLRPTAVELVRSPPRWQHQTWDVSNLFRFGGEPTWIQDAEFPPCASCGTPMPFVFQLDSRNEDGGWMWGSGGIAYFFWCDACAISASLLQCT